MLLWQLSVFVTVISLGSADENILKAVVDIQDLVSEIYKQFLK
jgi:hypothetical protein